MLFMSRWVFQKSETQWSGKVNYLRISVTSSVLIESQKYREKGTARSGCYWGGAGEALFAQSRPTLCDAPRLLSVGFSRQEYWSGLPSPGGLPDPGIKPESPALQTDSLVSGKPKNTTVSRHCLQRGCPIHFFFNSLISGYCFIPWYLHEFFI